MTFLNRALLSVLIRLENSRAIEFRIRVSVEHDLPHLPESGWWVLFEVRNILSRFYIFIDAFVYRNSERSPVGRSHLSITVAESSESVSVTSVGGDRGSGVADLSDSNGSENLADDGSVVVSAGGDSGAGDDGSGDFGNDGGSDYLGSVGETMSVSETMSVAETNPVTDQTGLSGGGEHCEGEELKKFPLLGTVQEAS